jgi:gamma-glutamylcyclotransferase (GGCT)/AIG2-like uncharacterized protein YtfP
VTDQCDRLFVYGTLRPGESRWHFLEPWVVDVGEVASAAGTVFDTGLGYPAAQFGGDGTIIGQTYRLRGDRIGEALQLLDEVEGAVAGLYRRVTITTHGGDRTWAYEYGGGLELTPIASGDWLAR